MFRLATAFSGVGAPEQALNNIGIDHRAVFAVEIDKYARQTYEANWYVDEFHRDVTEVDFKPYFPGNSKGPIDLLVAGPPCQAFSTAGKRGGLDDPRGRMVFEFIRILNEANPRMFLFENVRGLKSMDKGRVLALIQDQMRKAGDTGYDVYMDVLNAADYGIPQNRRRVFIAGFRRSSIQLGCLTSPFIFPPKIPLTTTLADHLEDKVARKHLMSQKGVEYVNRHTAWTQVDGEISKSQSAGQGTNWRGDFVSCFVDKKYLLNDKERARYLRARPDRPKFDYTTNIDPDIAKTIVATGDSGPWGVNIVSDPRLVDEKYMLSDKAAARVKRTKTKVDPDITRTLTSASCRKVAHNGSPIVSDPRGLVDEKYVIPEDRIDNVMERREFDTKPRLNNNTAGTLQKSSYTKMVRIGQVDHVTDPRGSGLRRLTPRECFRLQGFPDTFTWPVSDTQAYRQAGNSMAVPCVAAIIKSMIDYHGE